MAACADTSSTFGGLIAIQNLINASTPPPSIMSISYGQCETVNGAAANAAYNSAYQQAVAEGEVDELGAQGRHRKPDVPRGHGNSFRHEWIYPEFYRARHDYWPSGGESRPDVSAGLQQNVEPYHAVRLLFSGLCDAGRAGGFEPRDLLRWQCE
jgi:hypothetical protein